MDSCDKVFIGSDDGVWFRMSKYLHRFQKIDDRSYNSLIYNYLWFSSPFDFNDPYDCNIELDYENNTLQEIEKFGREVNEGINRFSEEGLLERVNYIANNPKEISQLMRKQDKDNLSEIGICCFSEKDDSLLMWSHYSDSHKGICLSFDFEEDKVFFTTPYCVEYPEKYPVINFINDRKSLRPWRILIATKSKEWKYEQEIRIVKDERKPPCKQNIEFKKKALSSIKFGYKSLEIEQIKIKSILEKVGGYEHVKFYKAKLKRFEFGMEYEEILI